MIQPVSAGKNEIVLPNITWHMDVSDLIRRGRIKPKAAEFNPVSRKKNGISLIHYCPNPLESPPTCLQGMPFGRLEMLQGPYLFDT